MCPREATAPSPKASRIRLKNQTIRLQRPWHPACHSVPGTRRMAMTTWAMIAALAVLAFLCVAASISSYSGKRLL